jgi:hypothetical protein
MDVAALATWITTAAAGLYLLSIWLIEYDKEFQTAAATRLPPLVLVCHVLFAASGLIVWVAYLIFHTKALAWTAVLALVLAATMGTTMAIRWLSVYRAGREDRQAELSAADASKAALSPNRDGRARQPAAATAAALGSGGVASLSRRPDIWPPERNFPLPVVIGHGLFAVTTLALVLLAGLGIGG